MASQENISPSSTQPKHTAVVFDSDTRDVMVKLDDDLPPQTSSSHSPVQEDGVQNGLTHSKSSDCTAADEPTTVDSQRGDQVTEVTMAQVNEQLLHRGHKGDVVQQTPSEDQPEQDSRCTMAIESVQIRVHGFLKRYARLMKLTFYVVLLLAYIVYLGFAIWYSATGVKVLLSLTILVIFCVSYGVIKKRYGSKLDHVLCMPMRWLTGRTWWKYLQW